MVQKVAVRFTGLALTVRICTALPISRHTIKTGKESKDQSLKHKSTEKTRKKLFLSILGIAAVALLTAAGALLYQTLQHDKQVQLEIKKQELRIKCQSEYNSALADLERIDTSPTYIRGTYIPTVESYRNSKIKTERQESSKATYETCLSDVNKIN